MNKDDYWFRMCNYFSFRICILVRVVQRSKHAIRLLRLSIRFHTKTLIYIMRNGAVRERERERERRIRIIQIRKLLFVRILNETMHVDGIVLFKGVKFLNQANIWKTYMRNT